VSSKVLSTSGAWLDSLHMPRESRQPEEGKLCRAGAVKAV
jgi:hypothetical protein